MTIVAKRGELSLRDSFIEILREIIHDENYTLFEELIIKDASQKIVKIPDIVILENGKFKEVEENGDIIIQMELDAVKTVVETKHPSKYASEGLLQLFKYCEILNIKNGFTTNFTNLLYYHQEEKPAFINKKVSGNLKEKCTSISKKILKYIKKPPLKERLYIISEESLIETLQIINDELKSFIKKVDIENIRDSMGIFEISSDKNVMNEITDEDIKNAASFLLLNQLLFYGILSESLGLVTFTKEIKSKEELKDIFNYIFHINYRAVYGYDILQFLEDDCVDTINSILAVFQKFNFHELKKDILGKIFHTIIPLNLRKRIAAYYTSNSAGELLARLSIYNENDKILDPACGSGTLLVAAHNLKSELLNKKGIKKKHQETLEEIFGIDISIFASHLSVINLSIQDLDSITNRVLVFIDDAFNILPSKSRIVLFSAHPKRQATKDGVIDADRIEIPLFNVIISNPPFTRIERLTDNMKDFLEKKTNMKEFMFGQAGLHVAFIIHSYNFLVEGGYLAMVLPAATFSSNYSEKIEEFILENLKIDYIISSNTQIAFSEDVSFKEILLICKKEKSPEWSTDFIILKKHLREINLSLLQEKIVNTKRDYENSTFKKRVISKKELSLNKNWIKFIREGLETILKDIYKSKKLTPQKRIIKFHEGYHLDAPYFFRIPNKVWEIIEDKETYILIKNKELEELKLPKTYLTKSLGRPQDHKKIVPTMSSYIVNIENNAQNRRLPKSDLKTFIEWGKDYSKTTMSPKDKKPKTVLDLYKIKRYVKSNRPWYTYGNYILRHKKVTGITGQIGGKIVLIEKFGVKTRSNIAFYSPKNLTGSNSFFFGEVITPKKNSKIIGAWFCSSFYLLLYLYYRREIGGDYGRIKITDFETFKCLNVEKLNKSEKSKIFRAFENYIQNFPNEINLYSQIVNRNEYLRELDYSILSSLNLQIEKSNEEFLEELYEAIIEELEKFDN